ncbi:MAG: glycerophosphoryl diester phosphodiesterase membrane domain-containing protein [Alphaproteobacteria bacterium]|nr:glycerophosphoryl diester phosphodiesterase membrane domain-containing protein [Alphaproteobacteria bacterium]
MNKLPVFTTIGQTFGFVVERRFFTLLRLVWFPSLIAMIVSLLPAAYTYYKFGTLPNQIKHQVAGAKIEVTDMSDPTLVVLELLNFVLSIVLSAIIAVSIHRLILLDDRRPGTFFYLRLSRQEWLYILAWVIYFILLMLAFSPFFAHLFYAVGGEISNPNLSDPDVSQRVLGPILREPGTAIALGLAFLFALVVLVRFGLVFPAIVAEDKLSFARSWELTRGNFWRLIGFWLLVGILGSLLLVFLLAIVGLAVGGIVVALMSGSETVGALGLLVLVVPAALAFLVYFVVAVAIFVAALSFSYQALAGETAQADTFK